MAEPNDQLRGARERVESPSASGACLSRQELAELVNAWVFEHTENRVVELDASYVAKLERGVIRWPREPERRAGFRSVPGVTTDATDSATGLSQKAPGQSPELAISCHSPHTKRYIRDGQCGDLSVKARWCRRSTMAPTPASG